MRASRTVRRAEVAALVRMAQPSLPTGASLYLVAETGQMWEGWIPDVRCVHVAFTLDGEARRGAEAVVEACAARVGLPLLLESPADVIPVPSGHAGRARDVQEGLRHLDPVSTSFRAIARGDEPDYRLVLRYLEHGWVGWDEMTLLLEEVLPRFTRETIAQDPAEFRRKYRGLNQMWRAMKH